MKCKIIVSEKHSCGKDKRWIIVSEETGILLDDAQGYGYTSYKKALKAWLHKQKNMLI